MKSAGIVAAGHEKTAEAAQIILQEGGNAFDAAIAAMFAACVAEPVLASLGGGGFLMAQPANGKAILYDFFSQTPRSKKNIDDVDFYPIMADFGDAQQEFHIGMGSIATPGVVQGAFDIQQDLGRLSMPQIAEPALSFAREGIVLNEFQHYISTIIKPILESSPEALALHGVNAKFAQIGESLVQAAMADSLEAISHEGADLFYKGEIAQRLVETCTSHGGHLTQEDLNHYQVIRRAPLSLRYRQASLATNPAPALGGVLIAFTLSLLEQVMPLSVEHGSTQHIRLLAKAMDATQQLRQSAHLDLDQTEQIFSKESLDHYRSFIDGRHACTRGTTQISIADAEGNLASLTLSNGEGCGYVIRDTGIMMNNMLGEEDLNPKGFHQWQTDQRIASMMAPTLLQADNQYQLVTGSGGSNRIRSAILQVIENRIDHKMSIQQAVTAARIHYEGDLLNLEPDCSETTREGLLEDFPQQKYWQDKNLFFGGTHTVERSIKGDLSGMGDPRRGGVCYLA